MNHKHFAILAAALLLAGTATVIAPQTSVAWPSPHLPEIALRRHDRYDAFVRDARALPSLRVAVIHPCSPEAIIAAVEIRDEGLLAPILVGPEAKIRAAADAARLDPRRRAIGSFFFSLADISVPVLHLW